MSETWENALEIRKAMCDRCSFTETCESAYNPDVPCPDEVMVEEELGIDF